MEFSILSLLALERSGEAHHNYWIDKVGKQVSGLFCNRTRRLQVDVNFLLVENNVNNGLLKLLVRITTALGNYKDKDFRVERNLAAIRLFEDDRMELIKIIIGMM